MCDVTYVGFGTRVSYDLLYDSRLSRALLGVDRCISYSEGF